MIRNTASYKATGNKKLIDAALLISFFLSGCCALMYQVGWQRSLYGIIGVDIDSITIIVSVFMLGIGFGGMIGGWIADKFPRRRIQYYAATEIGIAIYGLASLSLISYTSQLISILGSSPLWSAFTSFIFLIIPTILMGMTLPLLTMAFNEWKKSVGLSVGQLYFFNTLGAATGAGLVPFVLLPNASLDTVILLAAFLNIIVATIAICSYSYNISNSNNKK